MFNMTLVKTFPGALKRVIPLALLHSVLSPFLCISIVIAFLQSKGAFSLFHIAVMTQCSYLIVYTSVFWSISAVMLWYCRVWGFVLSHLFHCPFYLFHYLTTPWEKQIEFNEDLVMCYIDFVKAYDFIWREWARKQMSAHFYHDTTLIITKGNIVGAFQTWYWPDSL